MLVAVFVFKATLHFYRQKSFFTIISFNQNHKILFRALAGYNKILKSIPEKSEHV